MAISLVVAITDPEWFNNLRLMQNLDEVNFWAPKPRNFRALQPGELLLFKLPSPHNVIVGGGVFAYANIFPVSLAWEALGPKNGAHTLADLRRMLLSHRSGPDDRSDFHVGCRILSNPFFLPPERWIDMSGRWARSIVSYKVYSTAEEVGRTLWNAVQGSIGPPASSGVGEERDRYGEPYSVRPRLGQGAFRVLVTDTYKRRCAVSRERTLPALDAAHIMPYSEGGSHEASNGILLRRDIHRLFDLGYVTVTPDLHFEVSERIREDYENGRDYYALQGRELDAPKDLMLRPDPAALDWHNRFRFQS